MPFIKTAMLNDRGAARTGGSAGEMINHFTGVRMRVIGQGNLQLSLLSPDGINISTLAPTIMQSTNRISPFTLASFTEERVQLQISTDEIDEIFRVNRIILFAKATATMEPA